jgi:UDP-4-amino-4,6-dideoxy-N-acetyl-beta-L-altrosamine transaminase
MLPYARQLIGEDDIAAVVEVLRSDFLTTGPVVDRFEKAVADYVGTRYAVAVSNGTAALHAAMYAAGIGPGDEVITTPLTFAATANSVLYRGGTPVFADIDPETWNIASEDLEKKLTPRTKAVVPVHFTGRPCAMEDIRQFAKKHHLVVIEDAAHALGAVYRGKKAGSLGDMAAFSFHAVKHITTGEGGMVTTSDRRLYERLLLFRNHGITRKPGRWSRQEGPWYYEMQDLGFNYRLTDIQCALGLSQLARIEQFLRRREEIVQRYDQALCALSSVGLPKVLPDGRCAWHLYVIRLGGEIQRGEVFNALRARNIGVNVHYLPVYLHPYYLHLDPDRYYQGLCPEAERYYEEAVTLPLYPGMTDDDVDDVTAALGSVLAGCAGSAAVL